MKNLSEIANAIAKEHGMTNAKALAVVRSVVRNISNGIIGLEPDSRERVIIAQFGSFAVKRTQERVVRNLKTGENTTVPAGIRISFKASEFLKQACTEGTLLEAPSKDAPVEKEETEEEVEIPEEETEEEEIPDLV